MTTYSEKLIEEAIGKIFEAWESSILEKLSSLESVFPIEYKGLTDYFSCMDESIKHEVFQGINFEKLSIDRVLSVIEKDAKDSVFAIAGEYLFKVEEGLI